MVFQRGSEYADRDKAVSFLVIWFFISFLIGFILFVLIRPVSYLFQAGVGRETLVESFRFFKLSLIHPIDFLMPRYGLWITESFRSNNLLVKVLPFFPFLVAGVTFLIAVICNPNDFMLKTFGGGRMATYADVKKMKLFNGFVIVLGRFKGKLLKMPETLSALVVAPPGTGKTAGVVIPTILESPGMSIIVNDPKPELCFKTSGYRATQGPVFVINWGAEDEPDKGIYYPSWNPLSPSCLPPQGSLRDMYIDSMVAVIVEEPKGGTDPHWSKAGRNAMSGFLAIMNAAPGDIDKLNSAVDNCTYQVDDITTALTSSGIGFSTWAEQGLDSGEVVKGMIADVIYDMKTLGSSSEEILEYLQ